MWIEMQSTRNEKLRQVEGKKEGKKRNKYLDTFESDVWRSFIAEVYSRARRTMHDDDEL